MNVSLEIHDVDRELLMGDGSMFVKDLFHPKWILFFLPGLQSSSTVKLAAVHRQSE